MLFPCTVEYHEDAKAERERLSSTEQASVDEGVEVVRQNPLRGREHAGKGGKRWYEYQVPGDRVPSGADKDTRRAVYFLYDWEDNAPECLVTVQLVSAAHENRVAQDAEIREHLGLAVPPPLDLSKIPDAYP